MPVNKKSGKSTTVKKSTIPPPLARIAITRSQSLVQDQNKDVILTRAKRRADISPLGSEKVKRSALGNLTNNFNKPESDNDQKDNVTKDKPELPLAAKKTANNAFKANNENSMMPPSKGAVLKTTKILTRAAAKNAALVLSTSLSSANDSICAASKIQQHTITASTAKIKEKSATETINNKPTTRRISNEFEKTEDSLYMSALEDMPSSDSLRLSGNFDLNRRRSLRSNVQKTDSEDSTTPVDKDNWNHIVTPSPIKNPRPPVPKDIRDFDEENINDPFQVSEYAMDIFEYLKKREAHFPITDYMNKQIYLSKWMRSLLVDWMVEVQETFELNHETLYLAVKLVDLYLGKELVIKDKLQLVGAGALLIACKFDERTPPLIEDFLYVCDGAYDRDELIKIEMKILKTVDFELGIPLSYRFLRRYARCVKVPMPTLTLARYILEFSLMDYSTITLSDSQMACAVLFMALRMTGIKNAWNRTLEYYSGYKLEEFAYIIPILNMGLHRKPRETIKTIRNKYSHKIFFEVAKIPLMSNEKLFENSGLKVNLNQSQTKID